MAEGHDSIACRQPLHLEIGALACQRGGHEQAPRLLDGAHNSRRTTGQYHRYNVVLETPRLFDGYWSDGYILVEQRFDERLIQARSMSDENKRREM